MARQTRQYGGREALETRVDYVEGNLDKAIANFKEAMLQMESRYKESIADIKEMVKDNKDSLDKVVAKAESSRRWAIGTVVTIAIAVIGSLVTFIVFLLTNGFQVQV